MEQDQKKQLLKGLVILISAPVFVVGIWNVIITQFVSKGSMLGLILIITGSVVGYLASLVVAKLTADTIQKFFSNVSGIADGTYTIDTPDMPASLEKNGKVNEIMQSVNEIAISYAKVISSIEQATRELDEVSDHFASLFNEMTQAEENDIILLHDCYDTSVDAALRIVDILKKKGFEFVTVDELLMD